MLPHLGEKPLSPDEIKSNENIEIQEMRAHTGFHGVWSEFAVPSTQLSHFKHWMYCYVISPFCGNTVTGKLNVNIQVFHIYLRLTSIVG